MCYKIPFLRYNIKDVGLNGFAIMALLLASKYILDLLSVRSELLFLCNYYTRE